MKLRNGEFRKLMHTTGVHIGWIKRGIDGKYLAWCDGWQSTACRRASQALAQLRTEWQHRNLRTLTEMTPPQLRLVGA
jgi:hypothetical protein